MDRAVIERRAEEDDLAGGIAVHLADRHLFDTEVRGRVDLRDQPARQAIEYIDDAAVVAALGRAGGDDHLQPAVAVEVTDRDAEPSVEIDPAVLDGLAV